jgi:hypothetical protein
MPRIRLRKRITHSRRAPEGARVVAFQMLSAGRPADEVEAHLRDVFELADARAVVDEARTLSAVRWG